MTSAAARMRKCRARQRGGRAVLRCAVLEYPLIKFLLDTGRLTDEAALDKEQVEQAAAAVLDEAAAEWARKFL
jgi:hypothetical protein